jgi:hypothetical protein
MQESFQWMALAISDHVIKTRATWDALILQRGQLDVLVYFLQMSYTKDHEISYKGLQFVLEGFKTNFTYVLVLHLGDN